MSRAYPTIAFTESVRRVQEHQGSRAMAEKLTAMPVEDRRLSITEMSFIAERDGFYLATVNDDGWPYVQHRGGPKGFLHVLDETTLAFADFRGNRQYISTGNLKKDDRVALMAHIQTLDVEPERRARVVIDERTGTVVVGAHVQISEVAIAQGGLTVLVAEQEAVSQPDALAEGETTTVDQSSVEVHAGGGALRRIGPAASLQDVVNALNALGAQPRDLIAIFQALRTAGALQAEIEVQ